MLAQASILLIDDSPGECELFRLALAHSGLDVALYAEQDAESAVHCLMRGVADGRLPALILLDWHLPKTRGDKFLLRLRSDARLSSIPVIVFTTSDDVVDMTAGYGCGANGYVVKPGTFDELVRFAANLCGYWLTWNRTPAHIKTPC